MQMKFGVLTERPPPFAVAPELMALKTFLTVFLEFDEKKVTKGS